MHFPRLSCANRVLLLVAMTMAAVVNACTPTASGSDEFTLGSETSPPVKLAGGKAIVSGVLADCTQCQHPLPVRRLVINSRAITQTANAGGGVGTLPNGGSRCISLALQCLGNGTEAAVILTYYNMTSDDVGSSTFGSGQLSTTLECTAGGQWTTGGGGNGTNVAELECISA
ncbi:hypothetical protein niasHT_032761 [Heterodera trifolii]|uniref:C6 domain-containing protein n=1 Tax=Heterodera trifolii TaxID=157864 RepID=A0ABD2IMG3_9BILA